MPYFNVLNYIQLELIRRQRTDYPADQDEADSILLSMEWLQDYEIQAEKIGTIDKIKIEISNEARNKRKEEE